MGGIILWIKIKHFKWFRSAYETGPNKVLDVELGGAERLKIKLPQFFRK